MRPYFILIVALISVNLAAQTKFNTLEKDLEVQINEHNQAFYIHQLKKGETLYSLAKYFKVPLQDLLLLNDYRKGDPIPEGVMLIIPINVEEIRTDNKKMAETWVPLYYKVKPQETLYKISKVFFPQKIEDLITRNNISSFALRRGRKLLIGWWGPPSRSDSGTAEDMATRIKNQIKKKLAERRMESHNENPSGVITNQSDDKLDMQLDSIISEIVESDIDLDSLMLDTIAAHEINYKLGIASWDKSGFERENLFVMHVSAKPNSIIRLRYPVTGKEVTATVLGPIPKNVYENDIDIVITPAVAIALGALDSRFQIQMNYYE